MSVQKVCPRCDAEYLPGFETCADCNVPLVHPDERDRQVEAQPDALPPASQMVPIRIATVAWIRGFSYKLQAADIPHRVDAAPGAQGEDEEGRTRRTSHDTGVAIYVLESDVQAAMELDAEYLREQVPDQAMVDAHEVDEEACPACGEAVPIDSDECGGCGLPFLAAE